MKSTAETVTMQITLSNELYDEIQKLASMSGVSRSSVIVGFIRDAIIQRRQLDFATQEMLKIFESKCNEILAEK